MNIQRILFLSKSSIRQHIKFSGYYIASYLIAMITLYYFLLEYVIISDEQGSFVLRVWGIIIFYFAISLRVKEEFEMAIMLGIPRREFLMSKIMSMSMLSFIFSIIIVLEKMIIDSMNASYGFVDGSDPFFSFAYYMNSSLFVTFVQFFLLNLVLATIGLKIGLFFYRYGKRFMITFWSIVSSILFIYIPWLWIDSAQTDDKMFGIIDHLNQITQIYFIIPMLIIVSLLNYSQIRRLDVK